MNPEFSAGDDSAASNNRFDNVPVSFEQSVQMLRQDLYPPTPLDTAEAAYALDRANWLKSGTQRSITQSSKEYKALEFNVQPIRVSRKEFILGGLFKIVKRRKP